MRTFLIAAGLAALWASPASTADVPTTEVRTAEACAPACRVPAARICETPATELRERCMKQLVSRCEAECIRDLAAGLTVSIPHDLNAARRAREERTKREIEVLKRDMERAGERQRAEEKQRYEAEAAARRAKEQANRRRVEIAEQRHKICRDRAYKIEAIRAKGLALQECDKAYRAVIR